jgi:RNA polymerase sigma factor (sigma-70 family)
MLLPDVRYQRQFLVLDASGVGSARGKGSKAMTIEAIQARDGPLVTDLVTRAIGGDSHAWDALVERYIPLVWSICREHRLDHADARTVNQTVWLQLGDQLGALRSPAALAGWLAATTHRECDRIQRAAPQRPDHGQLPEAAIVPGEQAQVAERELHAAELHATLREAFAQLPPHCQRLIAMLIQDPPVSDAEISATLSIPARSIRRNCHSCLQRLRAHPAIAARIQAETKNRRSATSVRPAVAQS